MLGFGLVVVFLVFSFGLVVAGGGVRDLIRGVGFENVQYVDVGSCRVDFFLNAYIWGDIILTSVEFDGVDYDGGVALGGGWTKYFINGVDVSVGTSSYTFHVGGPCSGHHGQSCWEDETHSLTVSCDAPCVPSAEVCDGLDNDCDGQIDEDYVESVTSCGAGACSAVGVLQCDGGFEVDNCNAGIPGVVDICGNLIDDNCDGSVDEGCVISTYYFDFDIDGYGDPGVFVSGFVAPLGYVDNGNDCDDNDAGVNPGAIEICDNGVDENCDGVDDSCGIFNTYYRDLDSDGYGNLSDSVLGIDVPFGYVDDSGDCDDSDGGVNPGALEICGDGIDNDCDGIADEGCGVCSVDANCSDDYYEERYCDGDDIYRTLHDFSCVVGSCVENVSEVFVKECRDDCRNGKCRSDDDDDDDDDYEPVNFFVGGSGLELGLVEVDASDNVFLEGQYVDDVGYFWIWVLLLIVGIVVLMFVIVWARME